jgi:hypothetical protein
MFDMSAGVMPLIARPLFIKLVVLLLTDVLTNRPLLHTPVFDAPYRLILLLDPQPSLEIILDLCRHHRAMVCLVRLSCLQLNGRLTFSSGLPMAQGSLTMTLWVFWRCVLAVVIFFLAVFFVVILVLACINDVV